ncbi:hypothetical protein B296_00004939 [Ensete ventricosum]|uniref:Uncharacterized protein n=1 Tax=Ensete ventricosum TaxID=4639 RepID=A0A426ZAF5_ENSVE|nr:hypothetical protein B296_00004939 [Ensete ventricosum]
MCQSCARSESVESDDNVSDSCGVGSTSRYGVAGFSGMIEEASDRVFGGSYAVGPGLTSSECSREPPWLIGCREGSSLGGAVSGVGEQPLVYVGSQRGQRDCDLRDGHDIRSRWDWLFGRPVGEETGKTIL